MNQISNLINGVAYVNNITRTGTGEVLGVPADVGGTQKSITILEFTKRPKCILLATVINTDGKYASAISLNDNYSQYHKLAAIFPDVNTADRNRTYSDFYGSSSSSKPTNDTKCLNYVFYSEHNGYAVSYNQIYYDQDKNQLIELAYMKRYTTSSWQTGGQIAFRFDFSGYEYHFLIIY